MHPSGHIWWQNSNIVVTPYDTNPFWVMGPAAPLQWDTVMQYKYPLATNNWTIKRIKNHNVSCFSITQNLLINREYSIDNVNATPHQNNQYLVYCLQHLSAKCHHDGKGVLLFPKVVRGCTHMEYISASHHAGQVAPGPQGTLKVTDMCGHVSNVGKVVNSEGSVMEALVYSANVMVNRLLVL